MQSPGPWRGGGPPSTRGNDTIQTRPGPDRAGPAAAGLRVLAFCDHYSPTSSGGAERVASEVYRRLCDAGAEITVLSARPAGRADDARAADRYQGVEVVGVPALDLSPVLGAEAAVSRRLFAEAFRVADRVRPQVLHANSLHFQGSLVAALVQRRRGIPLVTTAHLGTLDSLPATVRLPTAGYEATVGRFVLRRSSRGIAVGPSVATHLGRLGVPADRVTVIPNGVDHDRYQPGPKRDDTNPRVVFVGRLIGNKGPMLLVDALARLRGAGTALDTVFVGDGPMRRALERRVAGAGTDDRVRFVGHTTDVAEHLADSDILVRPSLTEGMPLSVLEAMACGLCIVASDVPGNADLLEHGETGLLFPPGDVGALAACLAQAAGDPALRRRLGASAHRVSLAHSWDATAAATAAVLAGARLPTTAGVGR